MSDKKKKKKRKKESSFTSNFLYILLLLVLLACLAGLYLHSRRLHQQEEKMREEIIQKEQALSNNWIGGAETGFETLGDSAEMDAETDKKESKDGTDQNEEEVNAPESDREEEALASGSDTAADNAETAGNAERTDDANTAIGAAISNALAAAADQANADTASEASQDAEAAAADQTAPADIHAASILVLNGTKVPGVASYWQTQLQAAGFTQVATATYTEPVQAQTVIYSDNLEITDEFQALFPQAVLEKGTLTDGILPAAGETLPEQVDIYILIGKADARNK